MPQHCLVAICFHHVQTRVRQGTARSCCCHQCYTWASRPIRVVPWVGPFMHPRHGAESDLGITETSVKTQSVSEEVPQFYCECETEYTSN